MMASKRSRVRTLGMVSQTSRSEEESFGEATYESCHKFFSGGVVLLWTCQTKLWLR